MKTTALRLTIYAIALTFIAGCAAVYRNIEAPEVRLAGIESRGFDSEMHLLLTARLKIHNPNDIALPVRAGSLALQINGTEIGTATFAEGFNIPAQSDEIVDIPARLKFSHALSVGLTMLSSGETQADYLLTGHIDLAMRYLGRIRVNKSGTLTAGG